MSFENVYFLINKTVFEIPELGPPGLEIDLSLQSLHDFVDFAFHF